MKNPAFWVVCFLVAATPLFRGSVHAWAQTLIQILVVLGLILVVVKDLQKEKRRKTSGHREKRQEQEMLQMPSQEHTKRRYPDSATTGIRDGLVPGRYLWWVIGPAAALGVWSTVMSPHSGAALQGMVMLAAYLGFFCLVVVSVRSRKEQRTLVWE